MTTNQADTTPGPRLRVLVADDDPVTVKALARLLTGWGYAVETAEDGGEALRVLCGPNPPLLAILDWVMPELDGLEVCRRVRAAGLAQTPYLLLLTGRTNPADLVAGLEGGADEYVTKPTDFHELRARVQAARRVVELQGRLAERVRELEEALAREQRLQGLLPICAWCRKVRNDSNYWQRVEEYVSEHSEVRFSHGICPDCLRGLEGEIRPGADADGPPPE